MIRYCLKCKTHVSLKREYDRREEEVCATCDGTDLRFTLQQRRALYARFQGALERRWHHAVEVRRIMFRRSGQSGSVVSAWESGLCLDFFGPAPSIEAWEWDELELAHLLPDAIDEVKTAPTLSDIKIGDEIMMVGGAVFRITRRIRTRDHSLEYGVAGIDIGQFENISAKTIHRVVEWLPKEESIGIAKV